jgi:hypothetical protein
MVSAFLNPQAFPYLLPHVGYHHGEVLVGTTHREPIAANEGRFLEYCDGTKTLSDIAARFDVTPEFIASVAHWLLWWPDPIKPPRDRMDQMAPRLVLGARPEDPWLGTGGTVLLDADKITTRMLSCFQISPALHASSQSGSDAEFACEDEAALAARVGFVCFEQLGLPAANKRRETDVSDNLILDILREQIAAKVKSLQVTELFVPAGLGHNRDGQLLFEAVLSLIGEGAIMCEVCAYADEPATAGERLVDELHARFENSYLAPREFIRDIGSQMAKKDALLRVFQGRVDSSRRQDWRDSATLVAACARNDKCDGAERFWSLQFTEIG